MNILKENTQRTAMKEENHLRTVSCMLMEMVQRNHEKSKVFGLLKSEGYLEYDNRQ